jgi:hypothetical protein
MEQAVGIPLYGRHGIKSPVRSPVRYPLVGKQAYLQGSAAEEKTSKR